MPPPPMPQMPHQAMPQPMPQPQMPQMQQPQMPPQHRPPPMMNGHQAFPQPMSGPHMAAGNANMAARPPVQRLPPERRAKHSVEISDLRLKNPTEADARQLLSSIIVVRHEKWTSPNELDEEGYPATPSWERVTRTEEADISQHEANRKIRELAKEGSVVDKKASLHELIQRQLEETQAHLEETDPDPRYRYILTQLDWKIKKIEENSTLYHKTEKKSKDKDKDKKDKDGKDGKKSKKNKEYKIETAKSSKSKPKSKTRKERVSVTAYFKRVPRDSENALKMLDEIRKSKKPQSQGQPQQQQQQQQQQHQQQQQRAAAHHANMAQGPPMGQPMPHFPPQHHQPQQAHPPPQAMPQMPPAPPMHHQPRPQQPPMGFPMGPQPMGGQPLGPQPVGGQHMGGQPFAGQPMGGQPAGPRPGHIGGQGHQGRSANIEVVPPAGKGFKLYFGSPRDSRSSFTSDDGWESEGSEYMTPESSIGSSSRRSHHGRYRSRSRHRQRERPEAFGLEVPRRHSKRDVDYIPTGTSTREPASPGPKALTPVVDVDRLVEQAYRNGREDEAIRGSLRPKVIQAPPLFRRITDHEARREVFADDLDRMGEDLYRTRLDDEIRQSRDLRRLQDAQYERQRDDLERDRRMQDRLGRYDPADRIPRTTVDGRDYLRYRDDPVVEPSNPFLGGRRSSYYVARSR
ncbi:hypothetical protein PLICBS_000624 [Purpureocillium lilacinum]|uniref:uncharacterized protein n=1 Tax=Purpureocillium lilacinum TaxID=33203 RepID=UPI002084FAC0|nr:hypothetical protein PLICBS_000624 [Purpureocillium lilacinum]